MKVELGVAAGCNQAATAGIITERQAAPSPEAVTAVTAPDGHTSGW
ncbi:hypothetical protein ABIL71_003780 [Acinetobacter baumannii]